MQVQAKHRFLAKFSLLRASNSLLHVYQTQRECVKSRPLLGSCVDSDMAGDVSPPKGSPNPLHESIFVSESDPSYDIPMNVIHRPLQSFTEEDKVCRHEILWQLQLRTLPLGHLGGSQVQEFVKNMQRGDDFTPIEVLWVQKGNDDYYFAFGGCHRWEAHKRLGRKSINSKLVKTTPASLSVYLARDPFKSEKPA